MEQMVNTLAKRRRTHFEGIEKLTLTDIKQLQRKSFVPRRRTRAELYDEASAQVQPSWKGSGLGNGIFQAAPIMKPKLLDPWTLGRVQAPDKASTKFFFTDQQPFSYAPSYGKEFTEPPDELLSRRQRDILIE